MTMDLMHTSCCMNSSCFEHLSRSISWKMLCTRERDGWGSQGYLWLCRERTKIALITSCSSTAAAHGEMSVDWCHASIRTSRMPKWARTNLGGDIPAVHDGAENGQNDSNEQVGEEQRNNDHERHEIPARGGAGGRSTLAVSNRGVCTCSMLLLTRCCSTLMPARLRT